jgi:hypothetical protein
MEFRWICCTEYVIQGEEDKKFVYNLKEKPLRQITWEAENYTFEMDLRERGYQNIS